MRKTATAVVGMTTGALLLAVLAFGPAALLVGVPLLLGTVLVFVAIRVTEAPRRRLHTRRATRWDGATAEPGGLMSGFFEVSR